MFLFANLLIFYSNSLSKTYTDYEIKNINWARYIIRGEISSEQELKIREFKQVSSIFFGLSADLEVDEYSLIIDGKEYNFIRGNGRYFVGELINERSDTYVSENIAKAFTASTDEKLLICGSNISHKEDILLSEQALNWFGLNASNDLIGKQITIINGEYSLNGILCGILNSKLFGFANSRVGFIGNQEESARYGYVDISLKSFLGNDDFFDEMDEMFGVEDNHYFLGNNEMGKMQLMLGQQILCSKFLSLICVIIVLVSFAYISCNQFYLLQKNSTYYGVLKANGVSNRGVFAIHLFELIMLCVTALIIAFVASIGIFFALRAVLLEVFYIDLIFSAGVAVGCLFAFIGLGILFSFLITLFIYKKLLSKPTIYLLKK